MEHLPALASSIPAVLNVQGRLLLPGQEALSAIRDDIDLLLSLRD